MRRVVLALVVVAVAAPAGAQTVAGTPRGFSRADTLRGSNGPARAWWDVEFYDLHVTVSPADSSISGRNGIAYRAVKAGSEMQVDLQVPMQLDSVVQNGRKLTFRRDSNAFFVRLGTPATAASRSRITAYFHGKPRAARRPPWDGGYIWRTDSLGNRFIATANEGLGASVWWPTKDYSADEPDSQRVAVTVPNDLVNVSNGRLRGVTQNGNGTTTWEWFVSRPINNYNVSVNAGRYAHFTDYYAGENGVLTMDYYPLAIHEDTARQQFRQAVPMMKCFEHWFGPFPWYEDGFKLVEAPHLGMEHQSAIAYGNAYKNGYMGRDLSRSGWGLKWDFIIVHEAAHEWWGNSLSMNDAADMWIHESFANYSENLYAECQDGPKAGSEYLIGSRANIRNESPIVGQYGVNNEGSGDMYYKGGAMLHMMRLIVADDAKWRSVLRGAQSTFRHKTLSGAELRAYMSQASGIDLSKIFEQYLNTTKIPSLEYRVAGDTLTYRWANVVDGFAMPVDVAPASAPEAYKRIAPTTAWASLPGAMRAGDSLVVRRDFYVETKRQ